MNQAQKTYLSKRMKAIVANKLEKVNHVMDRYDTRPHMRHYKSTPQQEAIERTYVEMANEELAKSIKAGKLLPAKKIDWEIFSGDYDFRNNNTCRIHKIFDTSCVKNLRDQMKQELEELEEYEQETALKIVAEADRITDEIMLGDEEQATRALKAFEAKEY
jgi:hypothetical protein